MWCAERLLARLLLNASKENSDVTLDVGGRRSDHAAVGAHARQRDRCQRYAVGLPADVSQPVKQPQQTRVHAVTQAHHVLRPAAADRRAAIPVLSPGTGYRQPAGSRAVDGLQRRLDRLGFGSGPIDGRYGPLTTAAVQRFQGAHRLAVNGIAGPRTLKVLRRLSTVLSPGTGYQQPAGSRAVRCATAASGPSRVCVGPDRWTLRPTDHRGGTALSGRSPTGGGRHRRTPNAHRTDQQYPDQFTPTSLTTPYAPDTSCHRTAYGAGTPAHRSSSSRCGNEPGRRSPPSAAAAGMAGHRGAAGPRGSGMADRSTRLHHQTQTDTTESPPPAFRVKRAGSTDDQHRTTSNRRGGRDRHPRQHATGPRTRPPLPARRARARIPPQTPTSLTHTNTSRQRRKAEDQRPAPNIMPPPPTGAGRCAGGPPATTDQQPQTVAPPRPPVGVVARLRSQRGASNEASGWPSEEPYFVFTVPRTHEAQPSACGLLVEYGSFTLPPLKTKSTR